MRRIGRKDCDSGKTTKRLATTTVKYLQLSPVHGELSDGPSCRVLQHSAGAAVSEHLNSVAEACEILRNGEW